MIDAGGARLRYAYSTPPYGELQQVNRKQSWNVSNEAGFTVSQEACT